MPFVNNLNFAENVFAFSFLHTIHDNFFLFIYFFFYLFFFFFLGGGGGKCSIK